MRKHPREVVLALLVLSAAYLYSYPTPTLFYAGGVLIHAAAGVAMAGLLVLLFWRGFGRLGWEARLGWSLLAAGTADGLYLLVVGTSRPYATWLYLHIGLCLAALVPLGAGWLRGRATWRPGRAPTYAALVVVLAGASALAWTARTIPWQSSHRIENPKMAPATMDAEGDGPKGDFFPSSAQTTDGKHIPARYFMESDACQRCHQDIFDQWNSSAHHFSSFNNQWYRKSVEYMQDVVGVKPSKWCGGCHDPALLFSGMMNTPIKQIVNTPEAHAGLGCMMCHSMVRVKSSMGNGDYTLDYPELHELAASKNPIVRTLHDYLIYLNPEPHRRVFLKPFMRRQTAEFCSTCHKVHLDVPVNHYRWIRGFNEYDNWQASGVSGQGARSFYYPPQPMQCADCHMPLVASHDAGNIKGFVHSHRFPAANTALPYANEDTKQFEVVKDFLQNKIVSVDIFSLSPAQEPLPTAAVPARGLSTTFAVGEEAEVARPAAVAGPPPAPLTAPLNRTDPSVRRGDTVRVDVVVRTRTVGHFFPGGTVDAFDLWLELKAHDETGRVLFWSGRVADDGRGPVEPGAHFYRSLMVDEHGNPINKRNAWATRSVVYVRLIPPGAADTVHFRLHVPENAGHKITLEAKLNYRKFAWWNTQFSFAGVHDPAQAHPAVSPDYDDTKWAFTGDASKTSGTIKRIPDLPIIVLASDTATLNVLPRGAPAPEPHLVLDSADWTRWNDYGIGLLLQGNLKGAEAVFQKTTEIDPKRADGWVNLARVRVQEGNLEGAREVLDRALALQPDLARAHFFYGKVLHAEGHYDEALTHFRRVAEQYPRDRVNRNEMGRTLFLQRNYADAVKQFRAVLAIDPEDLEANYNLMLCYNGLGQETLARQFERRYLRFKANEASQIITGPYRRLHPEDNNERQPIHEHVSAPLNGLQGGSSYSADGRTARSSELTEALGSSPSPVGKPTSCASGGEEGCTESRSLTAGAGKGSG